MGNDNITLPPWADHFRIDSSTWQTLCSQAVRQKASPLDIALEMGLLNENKLIEFDRQTSFLLCLKTLFFNGPIPLELLKNYDYIKCRTKACMPVAQWDGQIIWAKLTSEPTGFEQDNPNAIWLLAPWSGLKKWFQAWEQTSPQPIVKPVLKAPIQPPPPPPEEDRTVPTIQATDKPANESAPTPPVGFTETKKPISIDFSQININPKFNPAAAKSSSPNETTIETKTPSVAAAESNPPPSKPPLEIKKIAEAQIMPALNSAAKQEDLAHALLGGWLNYFDKTMIFLFQGGRLFVWKWAGQWEIQFRGAEIISLSEPSMFKFVMDSKYPFHGAPGKGNINESFFKRTTNGVYPESVSILPVSHNGKILALLLGAINKGPKSVPLETLQSQCTAFATTMGKFLNSVTKAS